eukprot:g11442.t1
MHFTVAIVGARVMLQLSRPCQQDLLRRRGEGPTNGPARCTPGSHASASARSGSSTHALRGRRSSDDDANLEQSSVDWCCRGASAHPARRCGRPTGSAGRRASGMSMPAGFQLQTVPPMPGQGFPYA